MRTAFIKTLTKLAEKDDRICLVVGDLGYGVVEPFAKSFPKQFINVGVAEQNMIGIATGMSLSGKIVFVYSIGNFPTLRCLEQIRIDVCYHQANVKIVAVGGGFSYGSLGISHHALEDITVMRAMPNMTVLAPGDPVEVERATAALIDYPGPCYLRLGRAGEQIIHPDNLEFTIGKAIKVRHGTDLTIISTGALLERAIEVSDLLAGKGISVSVISMHTIKPLDTDAILKAGQDTGAIATLEEHTILGGLGGAVSEIIAESSLKETRFTRIGLESRFAESAGSQEYLRNSFGLSADNIVQRLMEFIS